MTEKSPEDVLRSLDLAYFTPLSARPADFDVTPALVRVARVVSAVALLIGVVNCVSFLIYHGGFYHGEYPWPWMTSKFSDQASRTSALLVDFSGPLMVAGVIACRHAARGGTRVLRCGLAFLLAARVTSVVLVLSRVSPMMTSVSMLDFVAYYLARLASLFLPAFLWIMLTRPGIEANLGSRRKNP